jgi:multiple sugar transport system substrate-binding protein
MQQATCHRRWTRRGAAVVGGRLAVGVGAGTLAPLLGGACGPAPGGYDRAPAPGAAPATLRLNYRTEEYLPDRVRVFMEQHPTIRVDLVADSGYEKLIVLVAAGELGDVVWGSTSQGSYYQLGSQGHLLHLDPLMKRDRYDLRDLIPSAMDTLRLAQEGKLFGVPNEMHTGGSGLLYNADLFEKAGVRPPQPSWTLDDLVDASRRLTADTDRDGRIDQWGIQLTGSYSYINTTLRAFGGEWLDPPVLGKAPAFDRPRALPAWAWLSDLRHRHGVHPVEGRDRVSFTDGNLALLQRHQSGIAMAAQVRDRFRMGAALMPKGPSGKRGSQVHLGVWTVNARTRFPDQAWTMLQWLTTKEELLAGPGSIYLPGARISAWNDAKYREAQPLFEVFRKFAVEEGAELPAIPANFKVMDLDQLTTKAFAPLWQGAQSADQAVGAVRGEYAALLQQSR